MGKDWSLRFQSYPVFWTQVQHVLHSVHHLETGPIGLHPDLHPEPHLSFHPDPHPNLLLCQQKAASTKYQWRGCHDGGPHCTGIAGAIPMQLEGRIGPLMNKSLIGGISFRRFFRPYDEWCLLKCQSYSVASDLLN